MIFDLFVFLLLIFHFVFVYYYYCMCCLFAFSCTGYVSWYTLCICLLLASQRSTQGVHCPSFVTSHTVAPSLTWLGNTVPLWMYILYMFVSKVTDTPTPTLPHSHRWGSPDTMASPVCGRGKSQVTVNLRTVQGAETNFNAKQPQQSAY